MGRSWGCELAMLSILIDQLRMGRGQLLGYEEIIFVPAIMTACLAARSGLRASA